jgi:hypothetical protein
MDEKSQITINDCEELCASLLKGASPHVERVALWEELWRRLMHKLGYGDDPNYELMLPSRDPNEPYTEENRIAAIGDEILRELKKHSKDSRACMKVFERINAERG